MVNKALLLSKKKNKTSLLYYILTKCYTWLTFYTVSIHYDISIETMANGMIVDTDTL